MHLLVVRIPPVAFCYIGGNRDNRTPHLTGKTEGFLSGKSHAKAVNHP